MLLLDRIIERAHHFLRKNPHVARDSYGNVLQAWETEPAYELSSVTPFFEDWEREQSKKIPRRPPFDNMWAEWSARPHKDKSDVCTIGCYIACVRDAERNYNLFQEHPALLEPVESVIDLINNAELAYDVTTFVRLDAVREKKLNGTIWRIAAPNLWFITDGGLTIDQRVNLDADDENQPEIFGIPNIPAEAIGAYNAWPAFMSFSLLHCRNIVAEDNVPDERTQRRVAKAGNPPRVTYKTLRIEVPAAVQSRGIYEGNEEDKGPRVRFHLCSGHFKHLTSERYKEKRGQWIWCPAHWKGSKELGEVHKRYSLIENKNT